VFWLYVSAGVGRSILAIFFTKVNTMSTTIQNTILGDIVGSHGSSEPTTNADYDALLGIREMLDGCEANQNERAIVAITALIEAGFNTGPRIVGAAKWLGFDPAHAGAVLKKSTGPNSARHWWKRCIDGIYSSHFELY
jgi:hypothetical protein